MDVGGDRYDGVADTPGHEQYTRNMATGASTAELAAILVDARKGILPQTRRHACISHLPGIQRLVLAVNKMDLVDFRGRVPGDREGVPRFHRATQPGDCRLYPDLRH